MPDEALTGHALVAAIRARALRECPAPVILLCDCDDWLTCAHPWPRRIDPVAGWRALATGEGQAAGSCDDA